MKFFKKLFSFGGKRARSSSFSLASLPEMEYNDFQLRVEETQFTLTDQADHSVTIRWDRVIRISVIASDEGPVFDDCFLCFYTDDVRLKIPSQTRHYRLVLDRLSTHYREFDFKAFINAMSCSENCEFICWEKFPELPA